MRAAFGRGCAAFLGLAILAAVGNCAGMGSTSPAPALTLARIQANGGRVAWYKGTSANHDLIAFDRIVDARSQSTETYVMNPDGSNVVCVTCSNTAIPKGFVGQPEWHPDGRHLVIQAENPNSTHTRYNHLAWGINQDLWVVAIDGTGAEKIYDNSSHPNNGALHPHFNADGTRLVFSERIATGVDLRLPAPGGENPWAGWQIHLADYDPTGAGTGKLANHRILFGDRAAKDRGFYETHGFFESRIVFSMTAGGAPYVNDVFSANFDGTGAVNLIDSPSTWDEHGSYSPSGSSFVFISSRADPRWRAPADNASTLRTELYRKQGGTVQQLTSFNANGDPGRRYLTSDFDWDRTGRRMVVQVAPVDDRTGAPYPPEIWLITFPNPQ